MKGISASALYDMFEKSQWWSAEQLKQYQQNMLRAVLVHAQSTSQFYKFRLAPVISNPDKINFANWNDIPILQRADLAKYGSAIQAKKIPSEHLPISTVTTSGSTGDAVTLTTTHYMRSAIAATGWRAQKWFDVDWSATLLTRAYKASRDLKTGDIIGTWGPPHVKASKRGKNIYANDIQIEDFFELMLKLRPDYVLIYSVSIEYLCDFAEDRKISLPIKMFFSRGGSVSAELRQRVKHLFNAEILESYATQECGSIAHRCAAGSGFHIHDETVFVEIVDKNGIPVEKGEEGRIVVTPFTSTATPLIRYDLGDTGRLGPPCPCGRHLTVLHSVSGRTTHTFRHPDGRVRLGGSVNHLKPVIGASRWQIAQIGATEFEVRYISKTIPNETQFAAFERQFRDIMFSDARLIFKRVDHIALQPSGKFIEFVNEWKPETAGNSGKH